MRNLGLRRHTLVLQRLSSRSNLYAPLLHRRKHHPKSLRGKNKRTEQRTTFIKHGDQRTAKFAREAGHFDLGEWWRSALRESDTTWQDLWWQ